MIGKAIFETKDKQLIPLDDIQHINGRYNEAMKDNSTWSSGTSSTSISANAGEKVYFRASGLTPSPSSGIGKFTISNGKCNVGGNVMSMAYGADFKGQKVITKTLQFYKLFSRCSRIVDASSLVLPATTLRGHCYDSMFYDCTSLTTAPVLPATTLAESCYEYMFRNCTKLNYIKMLATDISASDCLDYWVSGIASSGTFVKHPDMTTLTTGSSGIPNGWTVVNNGE